MTTTTITWDTFYGETSSLYSVFDNTNASYTNTTLNPINGSSLNTRVDQETLYDVPAGLILLLSFFYGSISVLAVVGNSLVMWIVATSRRMQNVTNCFIANLALADIVIGLFAIPFQFQAALLQRWNLPHFMCAFCPFVQVLSVTVSVFTLTAIAVDRHRAILNPLSARPSKKIAKIIIGGIWLVALAIATPMAIALRVMIVNETDADTHQEHSKPFCVPNNISEESMVVYRMILFFLQYLMPLCVISYVYARMAWRLWGSRAPGNAQDSRDANLMKNKKKVIKMLVIVVALFALCWLPLQTYQVLQTCFPFINEYRYINIIFFCCDWLAMSNSCYNPFIYGIYNEKFKREFKQRFPCRRGNWCQPLATDGFDPDKSHSIMHTRHSSVRSTTYDWRRSTRQPASLQFSAGSQTIGQPKLICNHPNLHNRRLNSNIHLVNDPANNNNKKSRNSSKNSIAFCLNDDRSSNNTSGRIASYKFNGVLTSAECNPGGSGPDHFAIVDNNSDCCIAENQDKYVMELYVFPQDEHEELSNINNKNVDEYSV